MKKRFGFTLAEVLITLGIIGVVAAMTIPTLIANTNSAKFRSQFKKTISTLSQAGLMAQAQYDFDYAGTTDVCSTTQADGAAEHPETTMTFCSILNGTLTGQTYVGPVTSITRNNNGSPANYALVDAKTIDKANLGNYLAYTLADGSIVAFNKDAKGCELPIGTQLTDTVLNTATAPASGSGSTATPATWGLKQCTGFIDVNGATLPNKEVTCTDETKNSAEELLKVQTPCAVKNDANHMTDVFPIVFHDATVEPASAAAKYVLTTSK